MLGYESACGTVSGLHHSDPVNLRPNQDSFAIRRSEKSLIAVVCDGCTEGKYSEVGSRLGCRLIAESTAQIEDRLLRYAGDEKSLQRLFEEVRHDVLTRLRILAGWLGGSLPSIVSDYFLFTALGIVLTEKYCFFFCNGDGVFIVDGEVAKIGPFPDNKPPYLAYGLVETDFDPTEIVFKVSALASSEIQSILVGSDGVNDLIDAADRKLPGKERTLGPVSQFWEEDIYFQNADAIRRKLVSAALTSVRVDENGNRIREVGLLPDDTTLVVIRRQTEEADAANTD